MAVQCVNMFTAIYLLSFLFISGVLAVCSPPNFNFVYTPGKMEALNGSCLQIPCKLILPSPHELDTTSESTGFWLKTNSHMENVVFSSDGEVTLYPMNITGNLSQKNCTTLFSDLIIDYTNTYFFRIVNKDFKATGICDPLQITVTDSPARPSLEIPGDLKEHQSVTVSCSAPTPCPHSPPTLSWTLQRDAHSEMKENPDGTFTTKIQSGITLSDQHDGLSISCSATYPVKAGGNRTAEEKKTLSVSYAPKDTSASISPPGLLSAGSWVKLSCSSRAKPPVSRFTWFKSSTGGAISVADGETYSFNVTEAGLYYCMATNDLGNKTSAEISLQIKEPPNGSLQWEAILGGIIGIITLLCLLVGVWLIKSKSPSSQQTQSPAGKEVFAKEPAGKAEVEEENIHYGEISFSQRRPEPSQASEQQQETLYAQVKVSEAAKTEPEELYAQVKIR